MPTIDEEPTQIFKKSEVPSKAPPSVPGPTQARTPGPAPAEEELDELYEEEPRRRPWAAMASVALSLALIFVGYQWNQAATREQALRSQMTALRADAEVLRLRAEEAQRQVDGFQKRLAIVAAEKTTLAERVATLEKAAQERTALARPADRPGPTAKVTPVVAKKRR